jgi:hypothetical protein
VRSIVGRVAHVDGELAGLDHEPWVQRSSEEAEPGNDTPPAAAAGRGQPQTTSVRPARGARGSPAMVAHRLDGQRASAAPAAAGTHCGRPYFGWVCSSPRRWLRSGGRRLGLLPGCGGWWRDQLWLHLGRDAGEARTIRRRPPGRHQCGLTAATIASGTCGDLRLSGCRDAIPTWQPS